MKKSTKEFIKKLALKMANQNNAYTQDPLWMVSSLFKEYCESGSYSERLDNTEDDWCESCKNLVETMCPPDHCYKCGGDCFTSYDMERQTVNRA